MWTFTTESAWSVYITMVRHDLKSKKEAIIVQGEISHKSKPRNTEKNMATNFQIIRNINGSVGSTGFCHIFLHKTTTEWEDFEGFCNMVVYKICLLGWGHSWSQGFIWTKNKKPCPNFAICDTSVHSAQWFMRKINLNVFAI